MELSELTAYAASKYHIREEFKWADFPGFSVLADPNTGKCDALLMRKTDPATGDRLELCDLKCGRQTLLELPFSYLSAPYRMHGQKWIGIRFSGVTDPAVVFRLFDRAVSSGEQRGYTIVLEEKAPAQKETVCQDTALPAYWPGYVRARDTVPDKIRKMRKLYEYGSGSFHQKCKNMILQGRFMQDYEDDYEWKGEFHHYFPTYHDMDVKQLRGYFSWRTRLRKGRMERTSSSFVYLYLYELINGIGTASTEESLRKMEEFENGYFGDTPEDREIRKNLRRWMLELAVVKNVPHELALRYADPAMRKRDQSLLVLRNADGHTDEAVYEALCMFSGAHLASSPAAKEEKGKRLIADVWRRAADDFHREGKDLFRECFGKPQAFPWRPLANAIYWEGNAFASCDYVLDECRSYHCRDGVWTEHRYEKLFFDNGKFRELMHAADLKIRRHLKTGHYLREKADEAWALPYIEAVLEKETQAEIEAARPKITIDLSGLEQIRRDAEVTRDSLLTEEEMEDTGTPRIEKTAVPDEKTVLNAGTVTAGNETAALQREETVLPAGLNELQGKILRMLLCGESPEEIMKDHLMMPSLVADAINEALFDEFGDTVLECRDDRLYLVEDYREDLREML